MGVSAAAACRHFPGGAFLSSRDRFGAVLSWLEGEHAGVLSHGELEDQLQVDARELFRQVLQEHLELQAVSEPRIADVTTPRGCHVRPLRAGTAAD